MDKLKCPFCDEPIYIDDVHLYYICHNKGCAFFGIGADYKFWQELIRTRKALDVALDWLEQVATPEKCDDDLCREFTKRKLDEIKTALEQKE